MNETHYQCLKVDPKATTQEIVDAYYRLKQTGAKDALATYSLDALDEIESETRRIEEAYQVLIDPKRRKSYDQHLASPPSPRESLPQAHQTPEIAAPTASVASNVPPASEVPVAPTTPVAAVTPTFGGAHLRQLREEKGLDLRDVAETTKIPSRYLQAMEDDDFTRLPARVYVQGFVKNIATLYGLAPEKAASDYLLFYDTQASVDSPKKTLIPMRS